MRNLPYRSIVITGARGFVGRHLVAALSKRITIEASIHYFDRTGPRPINLLDRAGLSDAIAAVKPDLVFHLAAQSSVGQSTTAAVSTWDTNVSGTINLAEAIATEAPEAAVAFISSCEIYGATFNDGPTDEDAQPRPMSVYARTKRTAEDALRDILTSTNHLVVFRPTNHSGPGQGTRFVLPAFADQIAAIEAGRQPPRIMVGSLEAERDFLDVRDVVEAYLDVMGQTDLGLSETFNVASGHPISIGRLLDELLTMTTADIAVEQDPERMRTNDIPRAEVNGSKLIERTGWRPRISLRQTIADVLSDRRQAYAAQA